MADETVEIHDERSEGRYEARIDGRLAGLAAYRVHPGVIDVVHTQVEPAFEGKGVAGRLAAFVLDDIRRRGLRVRPTCPFFAAFIGRHPDYQDLVAADAGTTGG